MRAQFITAEEVQQILSVSRSKSYQIIRDLNVHSCGRSRHYFACRGVPNKNPRTASRSGGHDFYLFPKLISSSQ